MKRLKFIISISITSLFSYLTFIHYTPANAQCGSAQLSRIFWDGFNHAVEGCIAFPGNYGFTFSGAASFTAFQNFTGSGNFGLAFGGLPEPLPPHTAINVHISSPQVSNTVSCTTNSQGFCAPEPDNDGDGIPNISDSCPNQGSIGFGIYGNGCPILDGDGDGVPDDIDQCSTQGNQGHGVNSVGCPNPPPDSDGDGVPDNVDQCPTQGNQGHGVNSVGCPFPADRDIDGVPDSTDHCPDRGNEGYGVDGSGCPNPPPQPVDGDRDGDGVPDSTDQCPDQPGVRPSGCPAPIQACYVGFLVRVVNLRSGPGVGYAEAGRRGFVDRPILAIAQTTNIQGETWYRLQSSTPLYVIANPVWVHLGTPCNLPIDGTLISTPVMTIDSDGDGVPDATDACPDRSDEGLGVDENGCPRQPESINIRDLPPQEILSALGCPIQTGAYISTAPQFILMMIVEAPDPCAAKAEYNSRILLTTPLEVAHTFFVDSPEPERQRLWEALLNCGSPILDRMMQFIANNERRDMIERFIEQAMGAQDPCALILSWRYDSDVSLPIPPDLDPEEGINLGIMLCSNPDLSQARYDQLVAHLRDMWGLSNAEITCDDINSANRIGTPNTDQLHLFDKLRECEAEIAKPVLALEKLIMKNNDNPAWLDVSCAELLEQVNCQICPPPFELPPELALCVMNDEDHDLMTLFVKNHIPKDDQDDPEGKLTPGELQMIYADINPCDAVIEYLNTGVVRQPIELPPIELPPIVEASPEITPTPGITATPVPNQTGGNTAPTTAEMPPVEEIPADILTELGFDEPRATSVVLDTIGIIYVRDNTIYIQENGVEKVFDDDVEGEKYSPIIFTVNNRRILAYILVQEGEARIRIINLSTNNATFARVSDLVKPHPYSRLAYSGALLVFTGTDPNGQFNLYGIPFSRKEQIDPSRLLLRNAKNASAVEGLAGFVFEQPNATNNIMLWIPGRQELYPIDEGVDGACTSPAGEQFGSKWRFWFLCESFGEFVLHTHTMQDQRAFMNDISSDLERQGAGAIQQLSLGELPGELFLSDDANIFLYHQREQNPKVERFLIGATAIFAFARE